jgi:hypothetical protein
LYIGSDGFVPFGVQLMGESHQEIDAGLIGLHLPRPEEVRQGLVALRTIELTDAHSHIHLGIVRCQFQGLLIERFRVHVLQAARL